MSYEKSILDVLNKIGTDNDHLLIWRPNNKLYTFKGNEYWRYTINFESSNTIISNDKGYPILISSGWNKIPNEFDSLGYIMFNGAYKLMFFKGSECWMYDDIKNTVADGYPKKISQFPLFQNKNDFLKNININHVFIWHDRGQNSYNCFVSGNNVYLIPWNKPSSFEKKTLNSIFPVLPDFVSNILPINNTSYIAFCVNGQYILYNEANGSYFDNTGQLNIEQVSVKNNKLDNSLVENTNINEEKNKLLEWCLQLHKKGIYSKDDYNDCIASGQIVGLDTDLSNIKNVPTSDKVDRQYQHALYEGKINVTKQKFNPQEPVMLVSHSGYYLVSKSDGLVITTKTIDASKNDHLWHIEILGNSEYGFKNNTQKFMQVDLDDIISVKNQYVGPLSKWKLIEYGTSYSLYHIKSSKSLRANPLGIEFYNPGENMIWDIIPKNINGESRTFDVTKLNNEKKYLLEKNRLAHLNMLKAYHAYLIESEYSNMVKKGFRDFRSYLDNIKQPSIDTYYQPSPMANENKATWQEKYNYRMVNKWRDQINSRAGNIQTYRIQYGKSSNKTFSSIDKDILNYSGTIVKGPVINGKTYYDNAVKVIGEHVEAIKQIVQNKEIEYGTDRHTKYGMNLVKKYKDSVNIVDNINNDILKWETDLKAKIEYAKTERDKYKNKLEYQLNQIDIYIKEADELDSDTVDNDKINLGNHNLIIDYYTRTKQSLMLHYTLLGVSCVWILLLLYWVVTS